MKKLLLGAGVCLILWIALYVTALNWVRVHTLQAIESATGARVQAKTFDIHLLAGHISLHNMVLVPKEDSSLIARVTVADATSQMRWREWSSGVIPLEATLDSCTIILHQENPKRFLTEHLQFSNQPAPIISQDSHRPIETQKTKIMLTALRAKNITILGGPNQPALASEVDCVAMRGMAGWQGKLNAASLGSEMLPFTHVQVGFSTESKGTRVADFRCNIKEGTLLGNGWCSGDGMTSLDLKVDSLQLASIAPTWFNNVISGMVSGSFSYKGNFIRWQEGAIVGSFALKNGALKLGDASQISSWLNGSGIGGTLQLDSAAAVLTLTPEEWMLSGINVKKEGVFLVDGNLSGRHEAKIKADLKLGIITPGQPENIQWTPLTFETTPDRLWQGILTSLLTSISKPAPAESPKPALQQKTKAAVDAVLNIFGH